MDGYTFFLVYIPILCHKTLFIQNLFFVQNKLVFPSLQCFTALVNNFFLSLWFTATWEFSFNAVVHSNIGTFSWRTGSLQHNNFPLSLCFTATKGIYLCCSGSLRHKNFLCCSGSLQQKKTFFCGSGSRRHRNFPLS